MTDRAFQGGGTTFQSNAFQAVGLSHYSPSGALTFAGAVIKEPKRALAGALTFTGTVVKKTARALAGALTFVGTVAKKIKRALAGAISFVGGIFGRRLRQWTITLAAAPSEGVVLDAAPTDDVYLDASPDAGIPYENV